MTVTSSTDNHYWHLLIRSACNGATAYASRLGLFDVVSVYDLLLRSRKWG